MQKRMNRSRVTWFAIAAMLIMACAVPALAVDTPSSTAAPDLSAPRAKIKAKDWAAAIADLNKIAETTTHADVYSLLGFALRNAGNVAEAKVFYAKALDFDPDHKGAHEYLGELYLKVNDMAKAKEQLVILEKLCPRGCEELDDLREHVTQATAAPGAKTN
jgi:Flp pilus assembly protein TadD